MVSRRCLYVRALFGGASARREEAARIDHVVRAVKRLRRGDVGLVMGPSGCGKSRLLRGIARRVRPARRVGAGPLPACAVIDAVRAPMGAALSALASAGLADAAVLQRSARLLSDGEAFRLRLARAMVRCPGGVLLVIDELASTLDRTTARTLCHSLRRWAKRAGVRVLAASAHDDCKEFLSPRLVVCPEVRA